MPLDGLDLDALVARLADAVATRLRAEGERLLDRSALAERLGICERSIGAMAARGDLPPGYLIGGIRRWDWAAVLRHLESRSGRRRRGGRGQYDADRRAEAGAKGAAEKKRRAHALNGDAATGLPGESQE
jgi:hypothetical protein